MRMRAFLSAWFLLATTVAVAQTVAPPATRAVAPSATPAAEPKRGVEASSGVVPASGWRSADGRVEQTSNSAPAQSPPPTFRGPAGASPPEATAPGAARSTGAAAAGQLPAGAATPRRPIARVIEGNGTLPNTHGQVWREYDISPYTLRVTATNRPEQAMIDWVLRETGYEVWHGEPLGVLSATKRSLRVYHTPEMQAIVASIVDRFVSSEAETRAFGLRVVTLDGPNWRSRVQRVLRPVAAQTPGTQAWLLEKEDAAMLLAELRRRNDYREHSSPQLLVNNGQSTVVNTMASRSYVRDVVLRGNSWPGIENVPGQIDEGFSLEFTPLLSLDGRSIDAMIKCDIDQVEKLIPVPLETSATQSARQRAQIEVPQLARCRFQERFRWPIEQVLIVDLGMVSMPTPPDAKAAIPGLPLPALSGPPRSDLLLFVESKGELNQSTRPGTSQPSAKTYHGRY